MTKTTLRQPATQPYDPAMEARVAVLEQVDRDSRDILVEMKGDIREIRQVQKSDFRLLFGAIITDALGLAGMMAGLGGLMARGFHWL